MCRQREGYGYLCVDTYRIPYFRNILFSEIISEKPTQLKWYKLINAIFNLNNGLVRKKKLLSALSCWKCRFFPSPTVPGLAIIWIITSLDSNVHTNVIKKKKKRQRWGYVCFVFKTSSTCWTAWCWSLSQHRKSKESKTAPPDAVNLSMLNYSNQTLSISVKFNFKR